MQKENHWERAGIQLAFSIMILLNTWLAPLEGLLVDRYGPRFVVMFGGLCAAAAWMMNSYCAVPCKSLRGRDHGRHRSGVRLWYTAWGRRSNGFRTAGAWRQD
jgi:MFS family permease